MSAPQAQHVMDSRTSLRNATSKLFAYCQANDWAGYDPYDALNSRVFAILPFLDAKWPRLALTQALKRSPVNIRRLVLIPKTQNPKAIALFLSALLKLSRVGMDGQDRHVEHMIERLIALRSRDASGWCWGYSFPWQTRADVVPRGTPNLVCTTFAANALLDVYEQCGEAQAHCLTMAVSAAEYILNDLYWTNGNSVAGFSYPLASLRIQIHNANFLAAALLCRAYKHTGEKKFLGPALRVARCSAAQQHEDGSWDYGDNPTLRWIDNFHTGYNLCALRSIGGYAATTEFESCIRRGLEFYRAHFFRKDGAARYFHNRTYPIDIHSVAQSIITLVSLSDLDSDNARLAHTVFQWAMTHMWDERGFFYYRVLRLCTIRTSYMRWSQAWMLLALSSLLSESDVAARQSQTRDLPALAEAC